MSKPPLSSRLKSALSIPRLPWILALALAATIALCVGWRSPTAWLRWGLVLRSCPDGQPVPTLHVAVKELSRGRKGLIRLHAEARFWNPDGEGVSSAPLRRFEQRLDIVDAEGVALPIEAVGDWEEPGPGRRRARLVLPELPDGEYHLRATIDGPLGPASAELPLPLYAPALVHLATDRPLYEPGQTIRFRAVTLRLADLAPLDDRPGRFVVKDPDGQVLLEEAVPAGLYGVAASDLPLADSARVGTYEVAYRSGDAVDRVSVKVEPFRLPRFSVSLRGDRGWYSAGDTPRLQGEVRYRSGAPVRDARIELNVERASGAWPLPTAWHEPVDLLSDGDGRFALELEPVPDDLTGLVSARVEVVATDATGERIASETTLVLSEDPIRVHAETEMGDGLVPDLNNRLYLRATTPDGLPLAKVNLRVSRAWEDADEGVLARTDADAVATLQLDPGQPVSIVTPPPPFRRPLPSHQALVTRQSLADLYAAGEPSLDERVVLDAWNPALEPCAALLPRGGERQLHLAVEVDASGRVQRVLHEEDDLSRCVATRLASLRGPRASRHLYAIGWWFDEAQGAQLEASDLQSYPAMPSDLRSVLAQASMRARPCVIHRTAATSLPSLLAWQGREGSERLSTHWLADESSSGTWTSAEQRCVAQAFAGLSLDEALERDVTGSVRFRVSPDPSQVAPSRSPTVTRGYQLRVVASRGARTLGETTITLEPGQVPPLRLRPDRPVLAPGDPVRVQLLRGPQFRGELPDPDRPVPLLHQGEKLAELHYDPDERALLGTIPEDGELHGLLEVSFGSARALLWVPRGEDLALSLEPDAARYRPGDTARLDLRTRAGEEPSPAAVSLFGLDDALSQLAPLTSPDDFGRVTVRASTRGSAFGHFDARDLLTGRIRGENAVLATLLRMDRLPTTPSEASPVSASGDTPFDPDVIGLESFYALLAQARREVAAWEASTPEDELMTPATMASLWERALEHQRAHDEPHRDAFAVPLTLHRLPEDLLELTDPRWLVADARRLPEDTESWTDFVREEAP